MRTKFDDITSRIAEPPTWFDECAVPRYGAFAPARMADIYASEAVLAEARCQACGKAFHVAFSGGGRKLAEAILAKTLHYGDPMRAAAPAARR